MVLSAGIVTKTDYTKWTLYRLILRFRIQKNNLTEPNNLDRRKGSHFTFYHRVTKSNVFINFLRTKKKSIAN